MKNDEYNTENTDNPTDEQGQKSLVEMMELDKTTGKWTKIVVSR